MEEIYKNLDLNNLEGEEWRDIPNYEGLYTVSNMGRVKSLNYNRTKQEKILKQGKMKNGYLYVKLCKDKKMKTFLVHRLVANAFIPNPNGYRCVNHKDEDKTNNCVDNLEWCTQKYNVNYKNAIQRRVEKQSKQVYQYSLDGTLIAIWQSVSEAGRNGFNFGHVAACCRGKLKHYKGYLWSYTEIN